MPRYPYRSKRTRTNSAAGALKLPSRDWREEGNVQAAMDALCVGRDSFPVQADFRAAGLTGLYLTLKGNGQLAAWAERIGLPAALERPAGMSKTGRVARERGQRGSLVTWTDSTIEQALSPLCEGRATFPTADEFKAAGRAGLWAKLSSDRLVDYWARRMGVERVDDRATRWTPDSIAEALAPLCAGAEFFPGLKEFSAAGLRSLHDHLGNQGIAAWADQLGVPVRTRSDIARSAVASRKPVWTNERVEREIRGLAGDSGAFPSVSEFARSGLSGMYGYLLKEGTLATWASVLGLRRREAAKVNENRARVAPRMKTDLATRLEELVGRDLRRLGRRQTATLDDELRAKSWAQYAVRKALGKAIGGLPVRTVPARMDEDGTLSVPTTLPLVPIDVAELVEQDFAGSAVAVVLEDLLLVVREDESPQDGPVSSKVLAAVRFCLSEHPELAQRVAADYEAARRHVASGEELHGGIGELMQPRTKGLGGAEPRTFAFYARPGLIEAMLSHGSEAADSVNHDATFADTISARRPSRKALLDRLETFFINRGNWGSFPSVEEFEAAGKETLYWQLRATDDMAVWARALGVGYAAGRTTWSGPVIAAELSRMLAGRAVFPTCSELERLFGAEGRRVFMRVQKFGGQDFWARWMGVLPRMPNDADIERALTRFVSGREIWPTPSEFRLAGLARLDGQVRRSGQLERWQEHFEMSSRLWTAARVERTVLQMTDRLGYFPTGAEMQQDAPGLLAAVRSTGGVRHWAQEFRGAAGDELASAA